ncbi:DNA cytosine methyltransferase [uncultured Pseudodesulfovibrio sp.]|uniref:DNA cytosine methyltransferase n=1 Tax=uncultured Pseudodesulfovibrio sp. TaxID=2035858 RepID=UPI0029C6F80A|nr:DNA cytosine methyltransferase [uncultured Pseudodesulfovibrio sp.]
MMNNQDNRFSSVELCAGAGGQALGLEQAGFSHEALIEIEKPACNTLLHNRPEWNVLNMDLRDFSGTPYKGVDLVAGGVPCPPFSKAGKQLGAKDERDLFPEAVRIADEVRPKAILLENVRGFLDDVFADYRNKLKSKLKKLGYAVDWKLLNASDFGVSQLRPRVAIVAVQKQYADTFAWPEPGLIKPKTVGELLYDLMAEDGWRGAKTWMERADDIAPTLVGGSKKHGGPDLGPTRARKAWASLGVDGSNVVYDPPERDFVGMPRLTVKMTARVQGFPDEWHITGKKTPAYRQIGNAFPPPVARAVAEKVFECLSVSNIFKLSKSA